MAVSVQQHYGSADIVERILAAVPWAPGGAALTAPQLYPFDQFHGRELAATQDHAARLSPGVAAYVLDIGSGIGGPARYIATTFDCKVSGIDLTPSFVAAAQELTALCGLADKVHFTQADAASLPFDDARFDHATCFYVGMNLPDKPTVLAQALRVMKPGGRLIWTEVSSGTGDPIYPLPWARQPEASQVESRETLLAKVSAAGFVVDDVIDETALQLDMAQKIRASGKLPSDGQNQANAVVLGPDFAERRRNFIQSMGQGLISSTLILAHKPG
jgi:SAM-dependent methyltransferase